MAPVQHQTVGILLIGDELLSGKVADENAAFLCRELTARGLVVRRVLVVTDEIDEVVEALDDLRRRYDYIITSGGIGPTHDDITVEAVGRALGRPLEVHPDLRQRARELFGAELEPAHLKMATIPRGSTLVESNETRWPALVVDRVFVLAGVPKIMRRSFAAVSSLLPKSDARHLSTLFLTIDEWTLAPALDRAVEAFPHVQIGSYPVLGDPTYRVRVTLEGHDGQAVDDATALLRDQIPEEQVVRAERSP